MKKITNNIFLEKTHYNTSRYYLKIMRVPETKKRRKTLIEDILIGQE